MYLKQMIGFLIKASCDHRVGPHHIALYISIFQQWCLNNGENPVSITQARLREVSKIGKTAYYRCIRELEEFGYIKYIRSYSPVLGSVVYLEELD